MTTKSELTKKAKMMTMAGAMLALLLAALDQTIVATAMPRIVQDLQGLEHLSWVFTAYMLASTVAVPIYGKLSDLYGRKLFFIVGIVIFLLGSALSGVAQSMTQLIIFRALQGTGAGAIMVNSLAIVGDIFTPQERGRWQGAIGAVFGLASVAGPLLGGWLTDNASWRWIFYVNIPIGFLALGVIGTVLPKITAKTKSRTIDYPGAAALALTLVPLLLALVWGGSEYPWASLQIIGLFAVSLLMLAVFIIIESRSVEPILPLDIFKNRIFSISAVLTLLTSMALFGSIVFVPLFAQGVIGISATNSGLILTPFMLAMVLASIICGQIMSRTGKYKALAIIGITIGALGMYLSAQMAADTTHGILVRNMIITGLGIGVTMPLFILVVQSAFDHSRLGVVTASTQLFRSIGGSAGIAILGSFMNNRLSSKLEGLSSEPFIREVAKANSSLNLQEMDANKLQAFLSSDGQSRIQGLLEQAPPAVQLQLKSYNTDFLFSLKKVLAVSIDQVFLAAAVILAIAGLIAFFMPAITLKGKRKQDLQTMGKELEVELAQGMPEAEPDLTA